MIVDRRGFVKLAGGALGMALLAGCSGAQYGAEAAGSAAAGSAEAAAGLDYLVLVNKQHKLPDTWEATVELVEEESLLYDDPVRVEKRAYDAYRELRAALAEEDVFVELDSCYRSVAEQQEVWDSFMEEYGEEYTRTYVAVPGYSEHHTGLALDLFLVIDGEQVYLNEDMVKHTDVWAKIHSKLADFGFILRYLEGKEDITGYGYEPWHIRYVDSPEVAHEIMDAGVTLEEYLGEGAPTADYEVDYGESEVYSQEDMDAAIAVIMAEFGGWEGCTMRSISFTDDVLCEEDLDYVNELREEGAPEFTQAIVFSSNFHSPSEEQSEGTAWEPDTDYDGWTWHLGRTDGGDWQLMTWGYA